MKKLIASALLLFSVGAVKAQTVELLPKVGINVSNQAISATNGEKSKVRFQGGLAFKINTSENFAIQPELNFIGKGTRLELGGLKRNLELSYLELPVLAKYSFGIGYVNAGPSIGLLLTGKDQQIKSYGQKLKGIDFGLQMGAGLAIPLGKNKLIVDGRYGLGLNNIAKSGTIKNRGLAFSLGYAISL